MKIFLNLDETWKNSNLTFNTRSAKAVNLTAADF
jgi:hypothetical protein